MLNSLSRAARNAPGFLHCIMVAAGVLLAIVPQSRAATPEEIDKAINRGKEFLFKSQKNGNWELVAASEGAAKPYDVKGGQWGGLTAIATYSLLAAGENPQDPRIQAAIAWLEKANIIGTYALGMRAQVWTFLDPKDPKVKENIKRDAALLMSLMKTNGAAEGLYDYLPTPSTMRIDHSVSQYGVLGMWAVAENEFLEVPGKYWQIVENAWLADQDRSGGWAYEHRPDEKHPITISMTAAGVATLFITQDFIHAGEGVSCNGNLQNKPIDAGMKWITDHFKDVHDAYAWYGIERIGVASGFKYFGSINWFHEGADHLLKLQQPDGSFKSGHPGTADTAFALLFLSRGRAPVAINKLDYDLTVGGKPVDGNWNQRPRDAANITRWVGKQTERFLNWQIVNLNAKVDVSEFQDAPILYISGNQPLSFTDEEVKKLRQYVDEGGLIVCNADCNSAPFANSIMKEGPKGEKSLADRLFPDLYEFRKLPPEHPIYTAEMFPRSIWKEPVEVYGLSNGAREVMLVFALGDPGRYWQTQAIAGRETYHHVMADIFLYATEKSAPRFKGQTPVIKENPAVKPNRSIKVARLDNGPYFDPEPGGWRRMRAYMHNHELVTVDYAAVKLGEGKLDKSFKLAHLTGTAKFNTSVEQAAELKKFIADGGTLVIDACGGSHDFADSADVLLGKVLTAAEVEQLAAPLPPADPVFSARGKKIEDFVYRKYSARTLGNGLRSPRLRAVKQNGRPVVYYSKEDLSVGLVGMQVDGVIGYDAATATAIMRNILLEAAPPPPAPPKPATAPAGTKPPAKADAPPKKPETPKKPDAPKSK